MEDTAGKGGTGKVEHAVHGKTGMAVGLTTIDFEHDTPALQEDMARNVAFVEDQAKRLLAETKCD